MTFAWVVGVAALGMVALALWLYAPDKPRATLEAAYPGDYRTVDGVRLRLRDTGPRDAPAVILLHGFGASLETWEQWAQALSISYRVIRFDLPGFGLTGPDPTGDYTDAREMQILTDLMDQLGVDRASFIGNSLGGRIVWNFAALKPDRVSRMVLVSPDGFASPGFDYDKVSKVPLMMQALPYVAPRSLLKVNLAAAYGHPETLSDEPDPLSRHDAGAWCAACDIGAFGPGYPARSCPSFGPHPDPDTSTLGRKGCNDPYQQRGRLLARLTPCDAGAFA